ncbi:MAG: TAXI family TRAP transporter solute-binding subunit [Clostridiaceae bacterium]|nr:TAXI family TRAP transporter solute-binding subunit [Clostridia bacterium]MDY3871458.1 TAXI family TRAP transporter solute-binding subunit [Clostridiaceae bacterium]
MKKLFALLLAFCMFLTLAACGAGDTALDSAGGQEGGNSSGEVSLLTAEERAKEFITVATGPTSGVYYPIGGAFATALGAWGYKTSAEATNATGANIQLILDGDAEIAIAMQDAVMQAYTATGAYEGSAAADSLRALMRLWPNYVQLVTTSNTGIHSVEDLRGRRVGVGAANSGVEINARMILAAYGMSYDDIQPDYLAYGEAIDNMKNGQCDAVFVTSGLPNSSVMELSVSYDMVVVPIDGEGRDKLVEEYPYYAKATIPANTYNNKEDVESVFVYNIMLVRKELSDDMVYDMLTGIFENIETIQASHNAANKNIYLDVGVGDLQLPLHPGAEAFWREQGYLD